MKIPCLYSIENNSKQLLIPACRYSSPVLCAFLSASISIVSSTLPQYPNISLGVRVLSRRYGERNAGSHKADVTSGKKKEKEELSFYKCFSRILLHRACVLLIQKHTLAQRREISPLRHGTTFVTKQHCSRSEQHLTNSNRCSPASSRNYINNLRA